MELSLYSRMLCYVFWSQVEYGIVNFISIMSGNVKGFTLEELFKSPFTDL